MNPTLSFLFGRRSIRTFKTDDAHPITDETVRDLLDAGMSAPSAVAKDPWRFVVVRERAMLARLAEGLPNGGLLAHAGMGIVVAGELSASHDGQLSYLLQDCSACVENILLAAHALGLGTCWLGVHPREPRMTHVSQTLGMPDGIVPMCVIAVGVPAESKEPRTRYNAAYVHHERW
jgi:nitroreductase